MTAIPNPARNAANAAMMVLLMEEAEAAAVVGQMSPDELEQLGRHMCDLEEIAPHQISDAILQFANAADGAGVKAKGGEVRARTIITDAVGAVKADSVMRRILPEGGTQGSIALELARWLEPEVLLRLIGDEMPQMIAVLLVQLDPQVAARVLAGMPTDAQPDIVHRIATLGPVSPAAIGMLNELLESSIQEKFGSFPVHMGGVQSAAEMINRSGKAAEKRIMPFISKRDKALAKAIENELLTFAHLYVLDAQMMGTLLREIDSEVLILALKGIPEDERETFFAAMSSRAVDGLKDEIEDLGRVKMEEVLAAQKTILLEARRLAADGEIILDEGEGDYV